MSTHNLPGLQPGRDALAQIAQATRTRAVAVRQALEALDEEGTNVRIGAAALLQSIDDDRAPLVEEGEQLLSILDAAQPNPAPAPVAPAPAADQAPNPAPAPVAPAPAAQPNPTQQQPATPATQAIRPQWGFFTWVIALLGGLLGFGVASKTRGWIGDLADLHTGFAPWALKALWIIGITGVGFYGAGFTTEAVRSRFRPNPTNGP